MFELTYFKPAAGNVFESTPIIERVNDPDSVVYSPGGVSIRVTEKTYMFIPWSRVTGLVADRVVIDFVMRNFGGI